MNSNSTNGFTVRSGVWGGIYSPVDGITIRSSAWVGTRGPSDVYAAQVAGATLLT